MLLLSTSTSTSSSPSFSSLPIQIEAWYYHYYQYKEQNQHNRGRQRQQRQSSSSSNSTSSKDENANENEKDTNTPPPIQEETKQQQQRYRYLLEAYKTLGLSFDDGVSTKQIQSAFRTKATQLHPDVNTIDSPTIAISKFQQLQKAYETLLRTNNTSLHHHLDYSTDCNNNMDNTIEWRFRVWRSGDRIACDRTDVAGIERYRPIVPATKTESFRVGTAILGHPNGSGTTRHRAEYLSDGSSSSAMKNSETNNNNNNNKPLSSVSRGGGTSKWVQKKPVYIPWTQS